MRVGGERGSTCAEQRSVSIMLCHFVQIELLQLSASSGNAIAGKDVVIRHWCLLYSADKWRKRTGIVLRMLSDGPCLEVAHITLALILLARTQPHGHTAREAGS